MLTVPVTEIDCFSVDHGALDTAVHYYTINHVQTLLSLYGETVKLKRTALVRCMYKHKERPAMKLHRKILSIQQNERQGSSNHHVVIHEIQSSILR
jgi:hypothetical protein